MLPPIIPYDPTKWKGRILQIQGSGVHDLQISRDWDDIKIRFELVGSSAEDFLNQLHGNAPLPTGLPPVPPINHQDEALAAARRDAEDAKRRAVAAENRAKALEDEVKDYQGEIDALNDKLSESTRPLFSFDPANRVSPGGYITPTGMVRHRTIDEQRSGYDRWVASQRLLKEDWYAELGPKSKAAASRIQEELAKYDPFTHGDN